MEVRVEGEGCAKTLQVGQTGALTATPHPHDGQDFSPFSWLGVVEMIITSA